MSDLDRVLDFLRNVVKSKDDKTKRILIEWIGVWGKYLQWEESFEPAKLRTYKRGEVIFVNFGFNVGDEYGGVHYAVVIENNNKLNGNIIVVPLTSLDSKKTLYKSEIDLGKVIPWNNKNTVAKVEAIRSISKIRIIKPKKGTDSVVRLKGDLMDLIDRKIVEIFTKPK